MSDSLGFRVSRRRGESCPARLIMIRGQEIAALNAVVGPSNRQGRSLRIVQRPKNFAELKTHIMLSSSFILKEKVNMGHLMRV